jgi:hypothetical protein
LGSATTTKRRSSGILRASATAPSTCARSSIWTPAATFTRPAFLALVAEYLGKALAPYEQDALTVAYDTVGPFAEATTRLAFEHALRVRGRGLHVAVYTHYVKVFHLSAAQALHRKDAPG